MNHDTFIIQMYNSKKVYKNVIINDDEIERLSNISDTHSSLMRKYYHKIRISKLNTSTSFPYEWKDIKQYLLDSMSIPEYFLFDDISDDQTVYIKISRGWDYEDKLLYLMNLPDIIKEYNINTINFKAGFLRTAKNRYSILDSNIPRYCKEYPDVILGNGTNISELLLVRNNVGDYEFFNEKFITRKKIISNIKYQKIDDMMPNIFFKFIYSKVFGFDNKLLHEDYTSDVKLLRKYKYRELGISS